MTTSPEDAAAAQTSPDIPDAGSHAPTVADSIGTLAWARRTGGRLSPEQRRCMQRESQARAMARQNEVAREAIRHLDLDSVPISDSTLARKAEAYAVELSPGIPA